MREVDTPDQRPILLQERDAQDPADGTLRRGRPAISDKLNSTSPYSSMRFSIGTRRQTAGARLILEWVARMAR